MKTALATLLISAGILFYSQSSAKSFLAQKDANLGFYGKLDSISNDTMTIGVNVYPNPATNSITIDLENFSEIEGDVEYSIGNIIGKKKKSGRTPLSSRNTKKLTVNIDDLPSGIYFVTVTKGNETKVIKLLITK